MKTVDEEDFYAAMKRLRDLRAWGVEAEADPWAIRQALLTALRMDTQAALDRGVTRAQLRRFDAGAVKEADRLIEAFER